MDSRVRDRFYALTKRENGCLVWTGHRSFGDRGRFHLNGKLMIAARAAWIIERGEIPEGMLVLHRCDNAPCVDIDHLFLGTQSENIKDMYSKGRGHKGSKNSWNANMTHCTKGHPYAGDNLGKSGNQRCCRTCRRDQYHARKLRKEQQP